MAALRFDSFPFDHAIKSALGFASVETSDTPTWVPLVLVLFVVGVVLLGRFANRPSRTKGVANSLNTNISFLTFLGLVVAVIGGAFLIFGVLLSDAPLEAQENTVVIAIFLTAGGAIAFLVGLMRVRSRRKSKD